MNIGKAVSFAFEDERWLVKIVIGGAFAFLSSLLIGIPFVLGYMVQTLRNVASDEPSPLPEWTELGNKFIEGLSLFVIMLIYALPMILLSCVTSAFGRAAGERNGIQLVTICLNCIWFLYLLLYSLFIPAAIIRYAMTEEITVAFRFGEIFTFITRNLGNYILAVVLSWVIYFIASFGVIICFVGVLFTSFWALLVEAHLYGQIYRLSGEAAG